MPAFRDKLDDAAIEALAIYLRGARTNAPGWSGVGKATPKLRRETPLQP
jgi:mono/diheme cytochrome c family protein